MRTSPSLSERIADGIVEIIETDRLAPGDALAPARELARRFEVTTPTVREALRRLEATDVVRFRHGSGTYVGAGARRRLVVNPHVGGSGPDSVLELVEARLVIEPAVAAAAAARRTDDDLERIALAVQNALHPQQGHERPAISFHAAVAAASGNALVEQAVEALLEVRARDQVQIRLRYDDRQRDHAEHSRIHLAIRDGDAAEAERLTREHLQAIREVVARDVEEDA